MSTTVTGRLNKAANIFTAKESTGFSVRVGVKYRDPKTKQDEYTNYSAVIFAKSAGQIQFYTSVLVEGAIIEITAEQLKIDSYDGANGTSLSIDMLNARLGYIHNPNAQQGQQPAPQQRQQAPQQQGFNQQQQAPQQGFNQSPGIQQAPQGFNQPQQQHQQAAPDFGSDLPF